MPKAAAPSGPTASAPLPPPPKSVAPDTTPVPIKERAAFGKDINDPRFRGIDPLDKTFSHLREMPEELKGMSPGTKKAFMVLSLLLLVTGLVLVIVYFAKTEKKKDKEGERATAADAGPAAVPRPETPRPLAIYRPPPEPTVAEGKHDVATAKKLLMGKYDDIYRCYEKAFKPDDTLELSVSVKKTGVVEKIDVVSNTSGKKEVEPCVQGFIEKLNFGALGKRDKKGSLIKWTLINTPSKPPVPLIAPARPSDAGGTPR